MAITKVYLKKKKKEKACPVKNQKVKNKKKRKKKKKEEEEEEEKQCITPKRKKEKKINNQNVRGSLNIWLRLLLPSPFSPQIKEILGEKTPGLTNFLFLKFTQPNNLENILSHFLS